MVITNSEFNIDETNALIAVTGRFDGVKKRVPFDPDNQPDCLEFLRQVDDGDIEPISVFE